MYFYQTLSMVATAAGTVSEKFEFSNDADELVGLSVVATNMEKLYREGESLRLDIDGAEVFPDGYPAMLLMPNDVSRFQPVSLDETGNPSPIKIRSRRAEVTYRCTGNSDFPYSVKAVFMLKKKS